MDEDTTAELRARLVAAEQEVAELRHRLHEAPQRVRVLEERLLEVKGQLAQALSHNEKLTYTLQQAKENIAALREEVDKLTQTPNAYGTFLQHNEDGTVDVFASGRKMRVALHPAIEPDSLRRGHEVVLNESLNVVLARTFEQSGEVVTIQEILEDGRRALVVGRADEEHVAEFADALVDARLRAGDSVLMDPRSLLLLEKLPRPEIEEVVLEEVPDITYADIGGLDEQIEALTDAVELPYLHRELFAEHQLPAPKGILLYGPPGCGKTLIAKAVANSLAKKVGELKGNENVRSYFLNIKGPELLNKYVGETERQIRLVFQRAREKADEGVPVIVFFDEMDSLFRTRGSGISSDMESTIVPQLLAEIDGVEALRDVIVIGASNREDLIDPAILRPGRLDVKIKIERPDESAAQQIFSRYLTVGPAAQRRRRRRARRRRPRQGRPGDDRADRRRDVPGRRREPLPRGDLPERRQGGPVLPGLRLGSDDREHRPAREEARHQTRPRAAKGAASASPTCSSRSSRSTRRTRTCRTRRTPTTGRRSPARRASASSTSAPSSTTATSAAAGRSNGSGPASTCERPASGRKCGRRRRRSVTRQVH